MNILFVDPVCPVPYIAELTQRAGGTEATCARVVKALRQCGLNVSLAQRGRDTLLKGTDGLGDYLPLRATSLIEPEVVITLRDANEYQVQKARYPQARHYLWLHDIVSGPYDTHLQHGLSVDFTHIIAVSQWHKTHILNALSSKTLNGSLKVSHIYNPVAHYCDRSTNFDPKQLIFFSSPHKGLEQVLIAFKALRTLDPDFKLLIANPGYYPDYGKELENVIYLKAPATDHANLMQLVGESLCTFYPQTVFEETFGLVYAESNAMGTPVLAHDLGAAREVLDNPKQLTNCLDLNGVTMKVLNWSKGERPTVGPNEQCSISEVTKEWVKLFKYG